MRILHQDQSCQDISYECVSDGEEIDEEYLKQNEVVTQQIQKYEELLRSFPMMLYRFWLVITIFFRILASLIMFPDRSFLEFFGFANTSGYWAQIITYTFTFGNLLALPASFLIWVALSSRSLSKIKKALRILRLSMWFAGGYYLFRATLFGAGITKDWLVWLLIPYEIVFSLVTLFPAVHVRNLLAKRFPFYDVSSFTQSSHP